MKRVVICALAMLLMATGCVDLHFAPRLPVEFVSEDEELFGAWFVMGGEHAPATCVIEEVAIPVEDGLINPASRESYLVGGDDEPTEKEAAQLFYKTAYRITIRSREQSENRKVLYGYVVPIGDEEYLGVHVGMGELAKSLGPFLTVPTFMLMKYEIDDEHLRLWMPHAVAFCVPDSGWEDAMSGSSGVWFTGKDEIEAAASIQRMGGLTLSPTIDELINYYKEHALEEDFFLEGGFEFRRVPSELVGG